MSSRTITSVVTADTIALNAAIFGYAGHSIVTPHQAIQQIWWTDERIEAKVTREFIVSKLRPNEREQLNKPIYFGNDLTDDTYLDWILKKAQRLYLILVECGVSDQIFGVVEDSWDDDDLPIPLGEVDGLALSYKQDAQLNRKFYDTQFKFLLRPLSKHVHIDYAPNEVIPVEFVHRLAPAAAVQSWSRLHLPSKPGDIFVRRKIQLGEKEEIDPALEAQFLADIDVSRSAEHDHIASIWASWTSKGSGFWMTSFVAEHTLKSFIEFRTAASLQKLSKSQRYSLLLDWMHCLADALAFLHHRGICHGAIAPSNILVDASNHVAFSDIASLKSFHRAQNNGEIYNYGAPENHNSPRKMSTTSPPSTSATSRSFFGHRRAKSFESKRSFDGSISSHGSGSSITLIPSNTLFSYSKPSFDSKEPPQHFRGLDTIWSASNSAPSNIPEPPQRSPPPPPLAFVRKPVPPSSDAKPADVFSLGCVFLEIISFIFKKKTTEFVKHRSTKHKNANGKGSHIDSSFHANPTKLFSWMALLEDDAQTMEDPAFRSIPHLFRLIRSMINPNPRLRPTAASAQERLYDTLRSYGGLSQTHCAGDSWHGEPPLSSKSRSMSESSSRPSIESAMLAFPYHINPITPPKSPTSINSTSTQLFAPLTTVKSDPPPSTRPPMPNSKHSYSLPWLRKPGSVSYSGVNFMGVA
jgi:serine/threonine protein kinase